MYQDIRFIIVTAKKTQSECPIIVKYLVWTYPYLGMVYDYKKNEEDLYVLTW